MTGSWLEPIQCQNDPSVGTGAAPQAVDIEYGQRDQCIIAIEQVGHRARAAGQEARLHGRVHFGDAAAASARPPSGQ